MTIFSNSLKDFTLSALKDFKLSGHCSKYLNANLRMPLRVADLTNFVGASHFRVKRCMAPSRRRA